MRPENSGEGLVEDLTVLPLRVPLEVSPLPLVPTELTPMSIPVDLRCGCVQICIMRKNSETGDRHGFIMYIRVELAASPMRMQDVREARSWL